MPNLRLALRTLFKSPFVTLVAILSLALGIGANSAIFSLFDQMLLRPLPVPNADELVNFKSPGTEAGVEFVQPGGRVRRDFQLSDVPGPREGANQLHRHRGASQLRRQPRLPGHLAERRRPAGVGQLLPGARADAGARPAASRRKTTRPSARTSWSCSVTTTGTAASRSNPNVLNETLVINGQAMTIVGVAPRGFKGTTLGNNPDVFVPLTHARPDEPGLQRLREPPPVLGLPVCAPEAGRVDRAGDRRDQRSVQGDRQ